MIHSMTPAERADPDIIDAPAASASRPARAAALPMSSPLVEQFKQMRTMMRGLGSFGGKPKGAASRTRSSKQAGRSRSKSSASQRRGGSGRTTPKGPIPVSKAPLTLPGLEKGDWPGFN